MKAFDLIIKALVGAACIAIVAYVGLSFLVYDKVSTTARSGLSAAAQAARDYGECSRARSLVERYQNGGKQRPGMMSWDEARRFVEARCDAARGAGGRTAI